MKSQVKSRWEEVGEKWLASLSILVDPVVVILLLVSIFLGVMVVNQSDEQIVAMFTVLLGLATGLLGGMADRRWAELAEGKLIYQRAQQAVRGLKLLLGDLSALHRRAAGYAKLSRAEAESMLAVITAERFEEVTHRCTALQERTLSAIEDWTDIVPEADIRTQIGEITKLALQEREQERRIRNLEEELKEAGRSKEEAQELKSQLETMRRELAATRSQLANQEALIRTGRYLPTWEGQPIEPATLQSLLELGKPEENDDLVAFVQRRQ